MAISSEIRSLAISYVEAENSLKSASEVFKVSYRTIRKWMVIKIETGDKTPRKADCRGARKVDYNKALELFKDKPDMFLGSSCCDHEYQKNNHTQNSKKS